jgi:O-antigen/teichoic acid export membrane protein
VTRFSGENEQAALPLRRRLIRGSGWVFAGKLTGSLLGLAVNAVLARLLGSEELGTFFLAFTLAMFGSTVAALGLERSVVRFVSASLATGRPAEARAAIRITFFLASLGCLVTASLLIFAFGEFVAEHVFKSQALSSAIVFVAAWLVAITVQTLIAETFRGFQNFRLATLFDGVLAYAFSLLVFAVLWAWNVDVTLGRAILVSAGGVATAVAIATPLLRRRIADLPSSGFFGARESLSVGWPLLVTNVATFLLGTGADLWILAAFRDQSEVALYGAASKLVFFIGAPLIIVTKVVPPIVAELHAQRKPRALEQALRATATLAGIPAAVVLIVFTAAGGTVLQVVYGSFYAQAALTLAILSSARLFGVLAGAAGIALMMSGHERTMMRITILSGVWSVALGILLAWKFGMVGVAAATASGIVLQNAGQVLLARRRLGIWTHARLSLRPFREFLATPSKA